MTKKIIIMLAMLVGLVSGASARETIFLTDFYMSADDIAQYAKQDATKYNHSCGPTSTLFVYNYYIYKNSGGRKVLFHGSNKQALINKAKYAIRKLYQTMGQKVNTDTKTFDSLIDIGVYRYKFSNVEQRSKYDSLDVNLEYLFNDLKDGIPVIVSLKGQRNGEGRVWKNGKRIYVHKTHSTNPVGNWNHIVVIFGYDKKVDYKFSDNDIIYYFDPYFGKYHYMTLKELNRVANQDRMDYLRFGQ